jgi:hypothetical protein
LPSVPSFRSPTGTFRAEPRKPYSDEDPA